MKHAVLASCVQYASAIDRVVRRSPMTILQIVVKKNLLKDESGKKKICFLYYSVADLHNGLLSTK